MKRFLLALGGLTLLSVSAFAAVKDPMEGTWKINDAKSSRSNGQFPKNMSLTIWLKFDGDKIVYDSTNDTDKDKPMKTHFEAAPDGKVYPFPESSRFNQVQVRRLDKNQYEILEQKDGDVIVGAYWWVSADGKQLIRRGIAKGADGHNKEYEEYFDKQ
jgi:hypothetical protein